jgi:hypothetical protein
VTIALMAVGGGLVALVVLVVAVLPKLRRLAGAVGEFRAGLSSGLGSMAAVNPRRRAAERSVITAARHGERTAIPRRLGPT